MRGEITPCKVQWAGEREMAWRRRLGLFFILLVLPFLSLEANAQGRVSSLAPYSVEGLSVGGFVAPNSRQYKRYKCQPSEQYANSIWCRYSEARQGLNKSLTILHLYNNIVTYVNKEEWPASFTAPAIERELTRLSQRFNSTPRI